MPEDLPPLLQDLLRGVCVCECVRGGEYRVVYNMQYRVTKCVCSSDGARRWSAG